MTVELLFIVHSGLDASQLHSRGERPIQIGWWGGHIGVDSVKEEKFYVLTGNRTEYPRSSNP
jgi:homoserine acetyltransferase